MIPILRTVPDMRALASRWRAEGRSIGIVPTMGALHQGHLALVRTANAACDRVVVTIFVNPRQFNKPDDLARYPRTEQADAALLSPLRVDAIFAPTPDQVYPAGFATTVSVAGVADLLEGARRPGHFDGVATVVTKLIGMTLATHAFFGQKDWQQLAVVNRFVADLNLPVQIIGVETLREADGLALSSRNARLSREARAIAPALHAAMTACANAILSGTAPPRALATCQSRILAAGFDGVDYVDLRDAATLGPAMDQAPRRLLAAASVGGVRLIDNIPVHAPTLKL